MRMACMANLDFQCAAWHTLAYLHILRFFQDVPRLQLSSSCPRAQLLGARWAADASLLLPRVAEAEFQQAAVAAPRTASNGVQLLVLEIRSNHPKYTFYIIHHHSTFLVFYRL